MIDNKSFKRGMVKVEKVDFKLFENAVPSKPKIEDTINANLIKDNTIILIARRRLSFDPESLLECFVEVSVDMEIRQEDISEIKDFNFQEFFEKSQYFTNVLFSKISFVISSMLDAAIGLPIVTPPSRQVK